MTVSASDPDMWTDNNAANPPVAWEFLALDSRWWFSNALPGVGVTNSYSIEAALSAWPALIEMTAEITEATADPARPLVVDYSVSNGVFSDSGNLLTDGEVGTYPLQIDTSAWPTTDDMTLTITVYSPFGWTEYGGVLALLGPGDLTPPEPPDPPESDPETVNFNCECEDVNDSLTLAEYRRQLFIKAGFAAIADNPPPGTTDLFNLFLQDAQQFIYRKYPALRTRRYFRWGMQEGVRFYGMRENDENWTEAAVTLGAAAPGTVTFTSAAPVAGREIMFWPVTGAELPSEITAYQRYFVVAPTGSVCNIAETADGTPITFSTDVGAYASYSPAASCVFNMEPYKNIEGAWVEDVNGTWLPLVCGIPGTFYTTVTQFGIPVRYEIRQCIEVFPGPNSDDYKLWIKGHFGLESFTEDTDKPTIDGQLVYLWALADALAYYGKPSAVQARSDAREYLGELVGGTHTGKRYVPGTQPLPPAVMPVLLPLPGE